MINKLITLEGAPQSVGGNFYCHNNPVKEVCDLFSDYDKIELLNDYDCLRIYRWRTTYCIRYAK